MQRNITDEQLENFLEIYSRKNPDISSDISDNRGYLGKRENREIDFIEGAKDYFQFHLKDLEEGYATCFFHFIKNGVEIDCPKEKKEINGCSDSLYLLFAQIEELQKEFATNQYYMGEKRGGGVDYKIAEDDFIENHSYNFGIGFRSCYCNRICSDRNNCNLKVKEENILC